MSLIYPRSSRLLSNICWRLVFSRADSNLSLRKLQDDEYVLAFVWSLPCGLIVYIHQRGSNMFFMG